VEKGISNSIPSQFGRLEFIQSPPSLYNLSPALADTMPYTFNSTKFAEGIKIDISLSKQKILPFEKETFWREK